MSLNRLPQHILQQIISHTVNISHPRLVWPLRLVCKSFNQELLHAVFDSDDTTLLDAIINRETHFYSDAGRFRCFRGFLLRHNHRAEQLTFWEQLNGAVSVLEDHIPRVVDPEVSDNTLSSPDRFMKIVSTDAEVASRENAIAMVCDALFAFVKTDISTLDLLDREWFSEDLKWSMLQDKKPEFWLLVVAARRNDMELCQSTLEKLKSQKDDLEHRVWIDNLADALRIPAQLGRKQMLELILAQDRIQAMHITRRSIGQKYNALEMAAANSQLETVEFFITYGIDLLDNQSDYARSFSLAIRSSKDTSTRNSFIELFTSLTPEWRSNEVTAGILEDICSHGDLTTVKSIVKKYQESPRWSTEQPWQWTTFSFPNLLLVEAAKSKNTSLVQYLIDNRKPLSPLIENSFSSITILEAIECSISIKQLAVVEVLFSQSLPATIKKEKLFAYAAINGNVEIMEFLCKDLDLRQKFKDDSDFWDFGSDNSRLGANMYELGIDCTPYVQYRNHLPLGTISLILALKAGNFDVTKWFLEQGIRLGRRYIEFTPWRFLSQASVVDDEPILDGEGTVFGFALSLRTLFEYKLMFGSGARLSPRMLLFTRGRSPSQIKTSIANGKKETRFTRFVNKYRIRVCRARRAADSSASVICAIEVPGWSYSDPVKREFDITRFDEMNHLLHKHHHPAIYLDYD